MSLSLQSFCMSVQPIEVRLLVVMQLQLKKGLNTVNARFTIVVVPTDLKIAIPHGTYRRLG